jgi:uncharacterized protein (TIGR03663 family)
MTRSISAGLFLAALAAALVVRLPKLGLRPMHHDEANQAVKFGALLERGEYTYDKTDHHGPTLYYATLGMALARGQKSLADLDETTLRLVPVAFGLGLLVLFLLFGRSLHPGAAGLAALLGALSPALTYYSRFYIHETLFAFFALGLLMSVWRYTERLSSGWAFGTGAFAGLLLATKETSVIVLASVAASLLLAFLIGRKTDLEKRVRLKISAAHVFYAVLTMLAVAVLLYSSLGRNFNGPADAAAAFKSYFAKAGAPGPHLHPWPYYLRLLAFSRSGSLVWSEGLILVLGLVGMGAAVSGRGEKEARHRLGLYLFFYTAATTLAFSLIPYKTPWNLLPFYAGWIMLAGIGGAFLIRILKLKALRGLAIIALLAGLVQLGAQNHRANIRYPADPRNPYAYAQTSPDFLRLVRRVEDLSAVHPANKSFLLKVVAGPYEQWPLPWYLRTFKRIGYWPDAAAAGIVTDADLVIMSEENAAALEAALGDRYQIEHYGLREGTLLILGIPNALWNRFLISR